MPMMLTGLGCGAPGDGFGGGPGSWEPLLDFSLIGDSMYLAFII